MQFMRKRIRILVIVLKTECNNYRQAALDRVWLQIIVPCILFLNLMCCRAYHTEYTISIRT